jgi:Flp pilus assembly pilin Flp
LAASDNREPKAFGTGIPKLLRARPGYSARNSTGLQAGRVMPAAGKVRTQNGDATGPSPRGSLWLGHQAEFFRGTPRNMLHAVASLAIRLRADQRGVTAFEYALIGLLVGVAIVTGVTVFGTAVNAPIATAANSI